MPVEQATINLLQVADIARVASKQATLGGAKV